MKLWKKVLAAVTAGVLCVGNVGVTGLQSVLESAGMVLSASAEEGTYGNLSYGVTNAGEIEITGCNMGVTSVEIPAEIDRKPVTSIGNNAFRDCRGQDTRQRDKYWRLCFLRLYQLDRNHNTGRRNKCWISDLFRLYQLKGNRHTRQRKKH